VDGERFGRSKSMDKRLAAAGKWPIEPEAFFETLLSYCDDAARIRQKTVVARQELRETMTEGFDAMMFTLGQPKKD
jgi:hypothetical protein